MIKKQKALNLLLIILAFCFVQQSYACNNVTPSFTSSLNKTCGIPRVLSLTNTSTGTDVPSSTFIWYLNYQEIQRNVGSTNTSTTINTPGTHNITLVVIDTSGCRDSATGTVTVTSSSPQVQDATGYTYSPVIINCILSANAPDSFVTSLVINDTANNYTIIWGDGSSNSGTQLLPPGNVAHTYQNLGVYTFLLISNNGSCTDTLTGRVINERQPVAGVIGPPTGTNYGCVPMTVKFTNNSSNISPTTNFTWNMGDTSYVFNSTTYADSFFHTYSRFLCNQTITMVATNACGSSTASWNPIQASDKDSAIIQPVNPQNCDLSVPYRFNNLSDDRYCVVPDVKNYYWEWGDGTNTGWSSSMAQQSHTYTANGTYTVRLIDSSGCGLDTATYILVIDSLPEAHALASGFGGCSPVSVTFTDSTIGAIATRAWNFGDPSSGVNNTSTDSIATHNYNSGGNYNAILTVSNSCGTDRDTVPIIVRQGAVANFNNLTSGCTPHNVTFTNTSTTAFSNVTYEWDFGDGTSSTAENPPAKTYTTTGNYTVTLISTDSCGADTVTRTFTVYGLPTANFTIPTGLTCAGGSLFFDNTSTNSTNYSWNWGDGSALFNTTLNNANKTYTTAGTYHITLIALSGTNCRDTFMDSIVITPGPTAQFTTDATTGCDSLLVRFTNSSIHGNGLPIDSLDFLWDFNNGNTSVNQNDSSLYRESMLNDSIYLTKLVVTNIYGCMDSTTQNITVHPTPIVDFSMDTSSGCGPLNINFSNISSPKDTGSINIMTFNWVFGNGNSSMATNENQSFTASLTQDSIYNSQLIGTSEHGCMDSITRTQRVYPNPIVTFLSDTLSGCSPLQIQFSNTSLPMDTGSIQIMDFVWHFGNGDSSIAIDTASTYSNAPDNDTNYFVHLVGFSEHGCRADARDTITLFPKPDVDFEMDTTIGCEPLTINFSDSSTHNTYPFWWFGNTSDTSSVLHPSHTFYSRDIYDSIKTISHTVISSRFCLGDTIRKDIIVYGNPIAAISVDTDSICIPENKQMLNNSIGAVRYLWTFGTNPNDTTSEINPVRYFEASVNPFNDSLHTAQLIAYNEFGCSDTAYQDLTVLPYPIASFTADSVTGCSPLRISFTNNSINYDTILWDFGDGTTSTLDNPTHEFIYLGLNDTVYRVVLTIKSRTCVDTMGVNITVHGSNVAFYNYERVAPCDAGYFDFFDQSINAQGYTWDFGDGGSSNLPDPRHLFNPSPYNDTAYRVKLTVNTIYGCLDSMIRMIPLPQRLRIGILDTTYNLCVPGVVNFENRTEGSSIYFWNFGDGHGSILRNPSNEYTVPGTYNYKLIAFDANGCSDSVTSTGVVNAIESPVAQFTFTPPKQRMPNSTFNFTDQSITSSPLTYNWNFYDTSPIIGNSTLRNPTYTFGDSGWYHVQLRVFNGSCYDSISDSMYIEPHLPIPDFTVDRNSGCAPHSVQFTNTSQYASSYIWYFGDGGTSTDFEPSHTYANGGTYNVTLFASGPGGEVQIIRNNFITVLKRPFTSFSLAPNTAYLPDALFKTRNETSGAVSYSWSWMDPFQNILGTSSEFEPYFYIYDTGYFSVQLIAISDEGCPDTLLLQNGIYVNPNGKIFVPNTFTPNGDNINDGFIPKYTSIDTSSYGFEIFNRWGERVFYTTDPTEEWKGNFAGDICQQGVYAWKLVTRFYNGDPVNKEGVVHLLR